MRGRALVLVAHALLWLTSVCFARGLEEQWDEPPPRGTPLTTRADLCCRPGIAGGMGVSYLNPQDVVDLVNGTPGIDERVGRFKSMVEFFLAASLPVSPDWAVKGEYVYLLGSFTPASVYGSAEFTVTMQMPTVLLQYVLMDEGIYNLKIGAGVGYHFGALEAKYATVDDRYTGHGIGTMLDLEGNTAIGENLYAYLGVYSRWEFVGDVRNDRGQSPGVNARGVPTTLNMFGVGARLGLTVYF